MLARTLKDKVCSAPNCGKSFLPLRPFQDVCGPVCAMRKVRASKLTERKQVRERREALKRPKDLIPVAQDAFNAWVRARDAHLPCVSCGETNPPMTPGGQWDAGHFLGRGAYPELRFVEDNCHKQCKSCNGGGGRFKAKERTVNAKYEEELIRRIGPERLELLKAPRPPAKWTADQLREITATYKAKRKELEQ